MTQTFDHQDLKNQRWNFNKIKILKLRVPNSTGDPVIVIIVMLIILLKIILIIIMMIIIITVEIAVVGVEIVMRMRE